MLIRQFALDGLGHLSALVVDEDVGVAVVVDPRRDVDVYLDEAARLDARITHVLETHLHNDYVSGGHELAAITGAEHVIGAGADLRHEHRPVRDGDAVTVGALRFTAVETPGHTPEHVAFALADTARADDPSVLFTGGSLLVGAVGRTDLLGEEHAVPYARAMFRSLHERVLTRPDFTAVLPTHGAGSLCSTGISSMPWSTIGYERRHNAMVQPLDVDTFVQQLLGGQPAFPRYFARMRPTNQAGPTPLGGRVPAARPLSLPEFDAVISEGGAIVDLRTPAEFAAEHIKGSVSIPAGSSFGTWLGWVVDPDRPVVFVLADSGDWGEAVRQALRVGYDLTLGHLRGGIATWVGAGREIESSGRMTVHDLASRRSSDPGVAPLVLDVRQAGEFDSAHLVDAVHIAAGDLPERLADLPRDRPIAAMCASGYRASIAASLLRQAGFDDVSWVADGLPAWEAAGFDVVRPPSAGQGAPDVLPRSVEDSTAASLARGRPASR